MRFGFGGGFSLRGRKPPSWPVIAGVVAGAFVLGIGIGYLTGLVPVVIEALRPDPDATASPDPSPMASGGPDVPVDLYPAIERTLDSADSEAGLTSLEIPPSASGTLTVIPGSDPEATDGITTWVRFEVEEGLPVVAETLGDYLINTLNDYRGWGSEGRQTFARTEGVADVRIVVASPETALGICARPHEAREFDVEPSDVLLPSALPSPSPSASASPSAAATSPTESPSVSPSPEPAPSCAELGIVVISAYDWAAGLPAFAFESPDPEQPDLEAEQAGRDAARAWLVNHFVGHIFSEADEECAGAAGTPAGVMANHMLDIAPCAPTAWPYPDAEPPPEPAISESPA